MVSIIAAIDKKRGIGKNEKIPWHISEDFKRFKQITMGHPIIMGRRTFESIGQSLPGRTNIVISRNSAMYSTLVYYTTQIVAVSSLEEGIKIARKSPGGKEEIFIIGGGQIYKEAIEKGLVDRLYLTIVEARLDSPPESPARRGDFGADTFFPDYSSFSKKISEEKGREENYKYTFQILNKP
ncbi:MAG: dihydrofolate reductase [Candidatus Levybacteria bacterium]|nr:dihydrofolate reductase [Candidatus Levybacteria bacterium]MBI2420985.1 dihydrofolate reductase [Candidatus Levybacteria bacterium]